MTARTRTVTTSPFRTSWRSVVVLQTVCAGGAAAAGATHIAAKPASHTSAATAAIAALRRGRTGRRREACLLRSNVPPRGAIRRSDELRIIAPPLGKLQRECGELYSVMPR